MVNLKDLIITHYGEVHPDQIVDSYEMIKGIIVDFEGQANFKINLDNTLPLIKGDPKQLKLLFIGFIKKAIEIFSGSIGEINIIHIKDSKSWIFAFFANGIQSEEPERFASNLIETVSEFNLAISKKSISRNVDIILNL